MPQTLAKKLQTSTSSRILALDVLRAAAIFLVLGRHIFAFRYVPTAATVEQLPALLQAFVVVWQRGGWIGVDLFFVLSGFLVSGLLFREHQQHGEIQVRSFLMRRGLKIYPPFYVLMLAGSTWFILQGQPLSAIVTTVRGELLFIQNYWRLRIFGYSWTLAVEEHFYILLVIMLSVISSRSRRHNPFRVLPIITWGVAVGLLGLRIGYVHLGADWWQTYEPSHLRMDSLLAGVLLSYFYHYYNDDFVRVFRRYSTHCLIIGLSFLAPAFIFELETTPFIYTAGFTMFYIGSGLLLAVSLVSPQVFRGTWMIILGKIGIYSYSIYLWHQPVQWWLLPGLEQLIGVSLSPIPRLLSYLFGSVAFGALMMHLIEYPVLRLRARWAPSRNRKLVVVTSEAAGD